jgi:hypothetical protein
VGLQLYIDDGDTNFGAFVDRVVPIADLWEDVSIHVRGKYARPACAKLNSQFLPRLKRFRFVMTGARRHEKAETIYSGWEAPNLVDVECVKLVPHNLPHKSTIKPFTLVETHKWDALDMAYLQCLSSVLSAFSSLTSLHLTFKETSFSTVDAKGVKGAKLPNLHVN